MLKPRIIVIVFGLTFSLAPGPQLFSVSEIAFAAPKKTTKSAKKITKKDADRAWRKFIRTLKSENEVKIRNATSPDVYGRMTLLWNGSDPIGKFLKTLAESWEALGVEWEEHNRRVLRGKLGGKSTSATTVIFRRNGKSWQLQSWDGPAK
ncbi:MAG: hypothetical protein AB7P04_04335 [Bacteriovoracia bacterium]